MKWFMHDANAILDSKLKKVKLKYGMEGYGLYWYCLECVARNVETHNLTFILEEDAELIAADTGIHYERVEEMMKYMVSLKLFEMSEGIVTCLKMASRADEYTKKLLRTQPLNQVSRQSPDSVPTKSLLLEENRIEDNRREEKKRDKIKSLGLFEQFWNAFDYKKGKSAALKSWSKLSMTEDLFYTILGGAIREAINRPHLIAKGSTPKMAQGWLSDERFNDEHVEAAINDKGKKSNTQRAIDALGGDDVAEQNYDREHKIVDVTPTGLLS